MNTKSLKYIWDEDNNTYLVIDGNIVIGSSKQKNGTVIYNEEYREMMKAKGYKIPKTSEEYVEENINASAKVKGISDIAEMKKTGLDAFLPCNDERLNKILRWTVEIDKMTAVFRRTVLIDMSRREDDAEHSWHIAVMAILFKDYASDKVDIGRAVKMCVVHDLIEIYAGDTFAFDAKANEDKALREEKSADKLFGLLPEDLGKEIRTLWEEFDSMNTPDSKYAACMDRIQPFLHNSLTNGFTWVEGKTHRAPVEKRLEVVKEFMPKVYEWAKLNIDNAVKQGWILE